MASRFAEFRFGWPVVLASALGIGLGLSPLPFYTIGVFVGPYSQEFGWSVAFIFSGMLVLTVGVLVMGPVIGFMTDRYGVRKVALTSVVGLGLTMMAFALGNGSRLLYLATWGALAVTAAGTLPITWTRAVTGWFNERRGLALGISLIGTGLFGALAKIYAAWLIAEFGWRGAYIGLGLLPIVIALPVAYFLLYEPNDPRIAEKAARARAATGQDANRVHGGIPLKAAVKDWRFWLLAYAFVPISFAVGGPIPNLETMMESKGFTTSQAVTLASVIGYAVVVGRLLGGYLLDRFWAPAVAAIILSIPAGASLLLAQPDLSFAMAATAIAILGLSAGVEYDLMAYLVSRYFGMANYASIYGFLYAFFALGAGIGPIVFGRVYDMTQSYAPILQVGAVLFVAGALPLLLLGKYRDFADGESVATES